MSVAQYVLVNNRHKSTQQSVMITNRSKPEPNKVMLLKWQNMLDFVANLFGVQASRITRVAPDSINTLLMNTKGVSPFLMNSKIGLGTMDEVVIGDLSTLSVENAHDEEWTKAIEHPKAYLGMPITWPDKEVFGTLSIVDEKVHVFTDRYHKILNSFREMVNTDLALLMESDEYNRRSTFIGSKGQPMRTGLCIYNEKQRVISWNASAEAILGYTSEEVLGKPVQVVFPMIARLGEHQVIEVLSKNQEIHTLAIEKSDMLMPAGLKSHVLSFMDQSEMMAMQYKVSGELYKDEQSGVYNHHSIVDILNQEAKRALRYQHDLSVIAISIDGYNFIEEIHGEGSLELIVQTLAIILKNETRDIDSIGRLTEDLFIISLPSTNIKAAQSVANRIETVTKRYSDDETPFTITTGVHQIAELPKDWFDLSMVMMGLTPK